MCPSGATCLPADCCFSDLALYKSGIVVKQQSLTRSIVEQVETLSASEVNELVGKWYITNVQAVLIDQSTAASNFYEISAKMNK
jgi:hypothetical protein